MINKSLQDVLAEQRQIHHELKQSQLTLEQRRAQFDQAWQSATFPEGTSFTQINIASVACEWVACNASQTDKPVLVFCHGGGYHIGSCLTHRAIAAELAKYCKTKVLTVDYRLAPEYKFPAAHDDVQAVVKQLISSGTSVVLIGDSGGAALAASTALIHQHPKICGLILLSPWLDADCQSDSYQHNKALDPSGNRGALRMMAVGYAGIENLRNPTLSPIYSEQLYCLPPTLLQVGSHETVLDEALLFAERAKAQGHDNVHCQVWPELIHGFHHWFNELYESQRALAEIGEWFEHL